MLWCWVGLRVCNFSVKMLKLLCYKRYYYDILYECTIHISSLFDTITNKTTLKIVHLQFEGYKLLNLYMITIFLFIDMKYINKINFMTF